MPMPFYPRPFRDPSYQAHSHSRMSQREQEIHEQTLSQISQALTNDWLRCQEISDRIKELFPGLNMHRGKVGMMMPELVKRGVAEVKMTRNEKPGMLMKPFPEYRLRLRKRGD